MSEIRTKLQNRSLHKYCELLAEELNAGGFDFKEVIERANYQLEVPFTKYLVKDQFWKPIQKAMYNHESTTEPTTKQYMEIYKVMDKRIAELTGVSVPWPVDLNKENTGQGDDR